MSIVSSIYRQAEKLKSNFELNIVSGEKRNRTAEAIIASNTVSDRRVPKVRRIKMKTRCDHDG